MQPITSPAGLKRKASHQESWEHIQDAKERKKVQNRIAQRGYRERTRKRVETLEQLCRLSTRKCSCLVDCPGLHSEGSSSISTTETLCSSSPYSSPSSSSYVSSPNTRRGSRDLPSPLTPSSLSSYFHNIAGLEMGDYSKAVEEDEILENQAIDISWGAADALPGDGAVIAVDDSIQVSCHTSPMTIRRSDGNMNAPEFSSIAKTTPQETPTPPSNELSAPDPSSNGNGNGNGKTALHLAAESGNTSMLHLLLRMSANPLARDHLGRTPLHLAIISSRPSSSSSPSSTTTALLLLLLQLPGTIHARDHNGQTPLHLAAISGNEELVERLVEAGSEVEARDAMGRTALHLAVEGGRGEVLGVLVERGADVEARVGVL